MRLDRKLASTHRAWVAPDNHGIIILCIAMTTWFVSRHPGALQWMRQHGHAFDRHVSHLDATQVVPGDTVLGTLPVQLAAQVCARGTAYWHLTFPMPQEARGGELGAGELSKLGAALQRFVVYHQPS